MENIPQDKLQEQSEKLFSPKFIPFYPHIQRQYHLTAIETLLFGFVDFYLSSASDKFYFGNEKLAKMLGVSKNTITTAVGVLIEVGLISVYQERTINGGTIRFIQLTNKNIDKHGHPKFAFPDTQNLGAINNNYTLNNLLTNKQLTNKQLINKLDTKSKHLITDAEVDWLNNLDEKTILDLTSEFNCNEQEVRDFAVEVAEKCQIKAYKYTNYKLVLTNWLRGKYGKRLSEKELKKKEMAELRKQYPGLVMYGGGYDGL